MYIVEKLAFGMIEIVLHEGEDCAEGIIIENNTKGILHIHTGHHAMNFIRRKLIKLNDIRG